MSIRAWFRFAPTFLGALALSSFLAACEKKNDSPAERAGDAVEEAGDEVEDAVD